VNDAAAMFDEAQNTGAQSVQERTDDMICHFVSITTAALGYIDVVTEPSPCRDVPIDTSN